MGDMRGGQSYNHPKYNKIQNLTKDELFRNAKINRDLKETKEYLKQNSDIIITTADKGNIGIIHKRATFIAYLTDHIKKNLLNGTYTIINDRIRIQKSELVRRKRGDINVEGGRDPPLN